MSILLSDTAEVGALWAAITSGRVSYTSWTALQAAVTRPIGSMAEVTQDDAGNQHTDPVSGEVVDNPGVYRLSPQGWQWLEPNPASVLASIEADKTLVEAYRTEVSGFRDEVVAFEPFFDQAKQITQLSDKVVTAGTSTATDLIIPAAEFTANTFTVISGELYLSIVGGTGRLHFPAFNPVGSSGRMDWEINNGTLIGNSKDYETKAIPNGSDTNRTISANSWTRVVVQAVVLLAAGLPATPFQLNLSVASGTSITMRRGSYLRYKTLGV